MHETPLAHHRHEQVLFDENNPRSLVRLAPPILAHEMRKLRASDQAPLLLGLTDGALRLELARRGKLLSYADEAIRYRFWREYDRIQAEEPRPDPINMGYVLGLEMPKETFYRNYILDTLNIAWLICRPETYEEIREATIIAAIRKLRQFCEQPDVDLQIVARVLGILKAIRAIPSRTPRPDAAPEDGPLTPAELPTLEELQNDPTTL